MTYSEAIRKAEERLNTANYNAVCLNNKGLATAYANKADWLSTVVFLAKVGEYALRAQKSDNDPLTLKQPEMVRCKDCTFWTPNGERKDGDSNDK